MGVSPTFSFLFGIAPLFHFRDFWEEERYLSQVSESSRIYGSPLLCSWKPQASGVWALDTGAWQPASLRGCLAGWYGTSTLVLGAILGEFLRL